MSASRKAPKPASGKAALGDMARLGTLGFEFTAGIAVFGLLGWWLDGLAGWRDSFPFLLLFGVFAGLGLGMYRLQLRLRQPPAPEEEESETPHDDPNA